MYFMEDSEQDILGYFFQESTAEEKQEFKSYVIDRVVNVLSTPKGRREYVQYGSDFIDLNSEMLAKPYPTKSVSYPRKYVDGLFELFGYDKDEYKQKMKGYLKAVNDKAGFGVIMNSLTNIFHTIAMYYSDMIIDRKLRDSARQQMGLTVYSHIFRRYFTMGYADENIMQYTHSTLDLTWELKKAESVVKWIDHTVEVAYGAYRTRLSLDMSVKTLIDFNQRMWTSFNQNMKKLRSRFEANMDQANIANDVKGDETYLTDTGYSTIRNNLCRMIARGDNFYSSKDSQLYKATARTRNVKTGDLYQFSQKVDKDDIRTLIDLILYVFLVKEQNDLDDINSSKYINRINNLPTAVDRAIPGKPIIKPMCEKYKEKDSIVKAYISALATYIMIRLNECRPEQK